MPSTDIGRGAHLGRSLRCSNRSEAAKHHAQCRGWRFDLRRSQQMAMRAAGLPCRLPSALAKENEEILRYWCKA